MLGYAITLLAAVWLNKHVTLATPLRYAIAILPALSIIAVFGELGRYLINETDEYLRDRMVRQTLYASGFSMALATLWGFLEALADAPHVPAYYIACVWFFGLGVGACIVRVQDK
jgi:hypothetical protein